MCLDPFLACFHFQPRQLSFRGVECYVCGPRYGKAFNRDSHVCPTIPEPLYGDFKVTELYLKVETPIAPKRGGGRKKTDNKAQVSLPPPHYHC